MLLTADQDGLHILSLLGPTSSRQGQYIYVGCGRGGLVIRHQQEQHLNINLSNTIDWPLLDATSLPATRLPFRAGASPIRVPTQGFQESSSEVWLPTDDHPFRLEALSGCGAPVQHAGLSFQRTHPSLFLLGVALATVLGPKASSRGTTLLNLLAFIGLFVLIFLSAKASVHCARVRTYIVPVDPARNVVDQDPPSRP